MPPELRTRTRDQSGIQGQGPQWVARLPREHIGFILGMLGVVMFSGTLPAMRIAVDGIDPTFVTAARAALAGIVAAACLIVLRRPYPKRSMWKRLATIAACLIVGFPLLSAFAMKIIPAIHASVIFGILPIATATAAVAIAGERPSSSFWIASAVGTCATIVFALRNGGFGALALGDLLLLASIVIVAIGYALAGRLSIDLPGWEVICWALVMMLPLSVPAAFILLPTNVTAIPMSSWGGFLYVSLISQLFAFFAWNTGLGLGGIARVGQIQLLQTFLSIWLASWVNREPIDSDVMFFSVIVVASVLVGTRMRVTRQTLPVQSST
ncbi:MULTISPECIES: DMT family transporter [unclassified Bradyrhizobium]|uniref:DMT family transporter n=1 Tax=unclassified Bradyrhizobium TaxID=2631580 RepID=UPI002916A65D|nr:MULTISPECIES: DMT family transporter [unclassified Bradyrhizobium]